MHCWRYWQIIWEGEVFRNVISFSLEGEREVFHKRCAVTMPALGGFSCAPLPVSRAVECSLLLSPNNFLGENKELLL